MKTLKVLSLGAGVQSTTLYLMSLRQDEPEFVPVFDFVIFADTQEEPRAVYEHLEWLKSLGGSPILIGTAGKLGDDLISGVNMAGQRFASIPSYTKAEGDEREGQTRRQCTKEYKTDVIERIIRRTVLGLEPRGRMPKDVMIDQYMGLSFDEPRRIIRVKERYQGIRWATPHFPLFDLEMSRQGCLHYLQGAAPGRKVPRSACVFCPFHDNNEWRQIRDTDPEGWARVVEIDEAIRLPDARCVKGMQKPMYLHRSCLPLRQAPIDTPESRGEQYVFGFASECEGMCGV